VGWTAGACVGCGGAVSVGGTASVTASVTTAETIAVMVAVSPATGEGISIAVAVGVGAGRVGVALGFAASVLAATADWARCASLLDMKPVMATYRPSTMTSRTIRKPSEYPLFIESSEPILDCVCRQPLLIRDPRKGARIILEKHAHGKRL